MDVFYSQQLLTIYFDQEFIELPKSIKIGFFISGLKILNIFRPDGKIPDGAFATANLPCNGDPSIIVEGKCICSSGDVLVVEKI